MPTYDYVCRACGHQAEVTQKMRDDPLRRCPKCRKSRYERLIGGGAAVLFKGSGFYGTDYRSESWKQDAAKDVPAPPCGGNPAKCDKPDCSSKN